MEKIKDFKIILREVYNEIIFKRTTQDLFDQIAGKLSRLTKNRISIINLPEIINKRIIVGYCKIPFCGESEEHLQLFVITQDKVLMDINNINDVYGFDFYNKLTRYIIDTEGIHYI